MSRDGWIAIRNFPLPTTTSMRGGPAYWKILKGFFREHKVCPKCKGKGFTIQRELETSKLEVVKYAEIGTLEKLKARSDIIFADMVKEVFLVQFAGKKICRRCHGALFVKRIKDNGE